MSKIRGFTKRISVVLLLAVLVFTGGTYATWYYAGQPSDPADHNLSISIGDFLWEGSGSLPTDDKLGENHVSLIDNIINHPEHGLNANSSYLNEQISDRKKVVRAGRAAGILWAAWQLPRAMNWKRSLV